MREGDTRASGGEGRREFIRVPPFVPSPGADKEAASGGRFLPLTPSSSLPPLPSPPRPLPLPASPARLGNLRGGPGGSVPSSTQLCPDPLLPRPRSKLSPGDARPVPSRPAPFYPPPPQRARVSGGESPKIIVSGRCTSLFALSLPINVNNPLWHRVSVSFPSSGETVRQG